MHLSAKTQSNFCINNRAFVIQGEQIARVNVASIDGKDCHISDKGIPSCKAGSSESCIKINLSSQRKFKHQNEKGA